MGLELSKLALSVEDTFGFSIPDEKIAELDTVGKLYDFILANRVHAKPDVCLYGITCYKLRRAIMSVFRLSRKEVQSSTSLAKIFHLHRRRPWRKIESITGLRLPQLRRPAWVTGAAVLMTIALAVAMPRFFSLGPLNGAILVSLLTIVATGYALYWLSVPLAVQFQPDCTTVDQLVKATLARNYRAIVAESRKYASDAEIWDTLCSIVAEQSGIRIRNVSRDVPLAGSLNAA